MDINPVIYKKFLKDIFFIERRVFPPRDINFIRFENDYNEF